MKKKTVLLLVVGLLLCFVTTVRAESSNVVKIGSDVTIEEGTKVHNVLAFGGQVTVDGVVENNIIAIGGSVVLTKTAVVSGDVFTLGGIIVRGRGAEVHGDITEINADDISAAIANALSEEWEGWSWIFAVVSISVFLGVLLLTILIVLLIPKPVRLVASAVKEKTFKVTIWGIIGLVLVVPLAVLLAVSVVGIVLIPLEMALVLCCGSLRLHCGIAACGQEIIHYSQKTGSEHDEGNDLGAYYPVADRMDTIRGLDGQDVCHSYRLWRCALDPFRYHSAHVVLPVVLIATSSWLL